MRGQRGHPVRVGGIEGDAEGRADEEAAGAEGGGIVFAQEGGERGEGHGHATRQVQHRRAHRHLFEVAGAQLEAVDGVAVIQLMHAHVVVRFAAGWAAKPAQVGGGGGEGQVVDLRAGQELHETGPG